MPDPACRNTARPGFRRGFWIGCVLGGASGLAVAVVLPVLAVAAGGIAIAVLLCRQAREPQLHHTRRWTLNA